VYLVGDNASFFALLVGGAFMRQMRISTTNALFLAHFLYSFLSWFGILALIQSVVNAATVVRLSFVRSHDQLEALNLTS
jgi:hypothetical protein